MKYTLLLLLFPLMMFAQDSTLIGDVDCSGEVNSQDASLILQFVTNVIDELPCEANMTGLTPEQLQEMIDMMEDQLSINYSVGSGGGCDFKFPEKSNLTPLTYNFELSSTYTVPDGKHLYILSQRYWECYVDNEETIIDLEFGNPLVLESGQILIDVASDGVFNGYLVDGSDEVEPVTHNFINGSFTIPEGKQLWLLSERFWDGWIGDGSTILDLGLGWPLVFSAGQVLVDNDFEGTFNGYLVDEDYFADCSGGGGSTTNSVAETGGSGFDIFFPDGYHGDGITWDLQDGEYIVEEGKILYVTNYYSTGNNQQVLYINGIPVHRGSTSIINKQYSLPLVVNEGDTISDNGTNTGTYMLFSGMLCEKGEVVGITHSLSTFIDNTNEEGYIYEDIQPYTVENGYKLYITHHYSNYSMEQLKINEKIVSRGLWNSTDVNSFSLPLIVNAGELVDGALSFCGYIVRDDYFSSAGSSSGSNSISSPTLGSIEDFYYPQGKNGEYVFFSDNNDYYDYQVPDDKTLYIIGSANTARIQFPFCNGFPAQDTGDNTYNFLLNTNTSEMPIIKSGNMVRFSANVSGFLMDESEDIEIVNHIIGDCTDGFNESCFSDNEYVIGENEVFVYLFRDGIQPPGLRFLSDITGESYSISLSTGSYNYGIPMIKGPGKLYITESSGCVFISGYIINVNE